MKPAKIATHTRLEQRGYDAYGNNGEGHYCSSCGAPSPMAHRRECPKPDVRKGAMGALWDDISRTAPVVCPQCDGTNCVSNLGSPWAYEPGPCPLCDGQPVVRCPHCFKIHRADRPCDDDLLV